MAKLTKKTKKTKKLSLLRDEKGLTTVEYIIVLALIAVVGFAIWRQFGANIQRTVVGADTTLQGIDAQQNAATTGNAGSGTVTGG